LVGALPRTGLAFCFPSVAASLLQISKKCVGIATAPVIFFKVANDKLGIWTGGPETAVPGCYDAVAMARAAGFRMLVMSRIASVMRRLSLNRSEPAKKSRQNIPKNHCRTTIAERMGWKSHLAVP